VALTRGRTWFLTPPLDRLNGPFPNSRINYNSKISRRTKYKEVPCPISWDREKKLPIKRTTYKKTTYKRRKKTTHMTHMRDKKCRFFGFSSFIQVWLHKNQHNYWTNNSISHCQHQKLDAAFSAPSGESL
jgi:hypothetical protein